ncbi:MAG: energy transducer TonB [Burkholderiales bacterium]
MNLRSHVVGVFAVGAFAVASLAFADGAQDSKLYKQSVAERIAGTSNVNASQAPMKALSVVGYTIDTRGNVVESWIVRSAGEKSLDDRALSMLQHAMPLPTPPGSLFPANSQAHLSEAFVFTTDGGMRLQSLIK